MTLLLVFHKGPFWVLFSLTHTLTTYFTLLIKSDLANYADDTTPYTVEITIDSLLQCSYKDTLVLFNWLKDNYLQMNPDKCKLIITNRDRELIMTLLNEVNRVTIRGYYWHKLDFNEHISKLCKIVSIKMHALATVSNFESRLLMKAFIESHQQIT